MAKSARLQHLQWRLEAAGYDLIAAILRVLPVDAVSAAGGALGKLVGPLTSTHRTVLRNLRLAFPDWDEARRRQMARAQWDNVGRVMFEFFITDRILADPSRIEIVGLERLDPIIASGKPAVFVSGHLANWELLAASRQLGGVEAVFAYRGVNNPYIDARMLESRRRLGVKLFAPKGVAGGRTMMAALASGVSVGILGDQKYYEGVLAPFFGHDVHTQHAPVRFAMRFGARLQPGWVERKGGGARFRLVLDEPIPLPVQGGTQADVEEGVRRINAFIEARAGARPWEYWWVHRRFPDAVYAELAAKGF